MEATRPPVWSTAAGQERPARKALPGDELSGMPEGERGKGEPLWRAVAIALVLMPVNALWIISMERVRSGPYVTSISLLFNVIFIMVLLAAWSRLAARWWPRLALRRQELVVIYAILAISSAMAGMDVAQPLVMVISHKAWFATRENQWDTLFAQSPPGWLMVGSKQALRGWYEGGASLYRPGVLAAWLRPLGWWIAFFGLLFFCMACLNVLVRKQWADRERLTFPIVQLPLALAEPASGLGRNRLFWIGLAAAGLVDLVNGLAYLYPALPAFGVATIELRQYLSQHPWSAIDWLPVTFYPAVIGLSFLLPVDLLFSCWFFYFWWKAQPVLSALLGWDVVPQFPYIHEQAFGSYLGLAIGLLWAGRGYLRQVWRRSRGQPSEVDDTDEALRYRQALVGLALGFVGIVLFCRYAGMSLAMAVLFFVVYLVLAVTVSRVRAEFGSPVHDYHQAGPDLILAQTLGTQHIGRADLGMFSLFYWFNRAYRSHPMPHHLESLQMARRTGVEARRLFWLLAVLGPVGLACGCWAYLHLGYALGTASKFWSGYGYGWESFGRLQTWLQAPQQPSYGGSVAIGVGALSALWLFAMRVQFLWWPFHPVGYAIASSWSINLCWMPMLIAWAIKVTILRYGGLRLLRQATPLFLGLIVGEAMVGCGWSLFGLATGQPYYSFWGR